MAWGKNGTPDTLTTAGINMNVSDLGGSKSNVVLSHTKRATSTPYTTLYLNNDNSNNSYSRRQSENAGNDGTAVDQNTVIYDMGGDDADKFEITYICGVATSEKLAIGFGINAGPSAGASGVPESGEFVWKWENTSDTINRVDNQSGAGNYDTGSNLSVLGSDITPADAVPPLDNVQGNSLFVDKVNANRYWFDANPLVDDNFSSSSGWNQVTNTASGVVDGQLIGLTNSSGTNGAGAWKDYGLIDDEKFVLRCKFQIVTQSGGSGNASTLYFGISDTNGITSPHSNRDGFGIAITNYASSGMLWLYPNGTTWDNADTDLSLTPTQTTYYLEIARTSATSVTFKLFSDEYSTVVKTHTQTIASTLNGLKYIMFQEWRNGSGNTTKVAVDDLQIFNGVSTVSGGGGQWIWEKEDIRGLFMGGDTGSASNVIDYITIATTGNATDFGDLVVATYDLGACSSHSRGVYGGGNTGSFTNNMGYVTIATAGNATDFGNLTVARGEAVPTASNRTRGLWGGGWNGSANVNTIDYVTIDTTGNAIDFGDLTASRRAHAGSGNSGTRGLWAGGYVSSFVDTIDYVTIATLGNASDFGDLTSSRGQLTGLSNTTRTLFAGGGSYSNTIDYVTNDTTGDATDFGNLTASLDQVGTCSSTTKGVMGGGSTGSYSNVIQYVTIATEGDASDFGDLTVARGQQCNGASGK